MSAIYRDLGCEHCRGLGVIDYPNGRGGRSIMSCRCDTRVDPEHLFHLVARLVVKMKEVDERLDEIQNAPRRPGPKRRRNAKPAK